MLLTTIEFIPQELIARDHPIALIIGLGLFLSFILIALAKLVQSDIYVALTVSFVKNKGLFGYLRESLPVQKMGSMLLLLNYWLSISLLLLIMVNTHPIQIESSIWLIVGLPISVLFYHLGSLYLVGLFSAETGAIQTPVLMKINGAQILGLGCSILVFLISMHFIEQQVFIYSTIILFLLENTVRLIRSLVYVIAKGVSWYYIIMYLCTLEILPLFMTFYVVAVV
jgi:hypothetical protein